MDAGSADAFDTSYFQNLLANRGLLASDQTLTTDNATAALVEQNAYNMYLFATKFGDAMVKMGGIQVLTGSDGQIRTNCRALNRFCPIFVFSFSQTFFKARQEH
jgi:peroxidase